MKKNRFKNLRDLPEATNFKGNMLRKSEREEYYRRKNEEYRDRQREAWFAENSGGIFYWGIVVVVVIIFAAMFGEGDNSSPSTTSTSQRRPTEQSTTVERPRSTEKPRPQEQPRAPEYTPLPPNVSVDIDGAAPNSIVYVMFLLVGQGTGVRGCRSEDECFQLRRAVDAVQSGERVPVGAAFTYSNYASTYGQAHLDLPRSILASDGVTYELSGPNLRIAVATSANPRAGIISVPDFSSRTTLRLRAP